MVYFHFASCHICLDCAQISKGLLGILLDQKVGIVVEPAGGGIRVVGAIVLALHRFLLALYWYELDTLSLDVAAVRVLYRCHLISGHF